MPCPNSSASPVIGDFGTSHDTSTSGPPLRPLRPFTAIVLGSLTVGILDGAFAVIRAGLKGTPPTRVFQSIAAGLIGRPAYDGGATSALLGVGLHFLIAAGVVLAYFLASRRLRTLTEHPWLLGALYGIAVFGVMNFVVIPLSALSFRPRNLVVMLPGILIHIFGVGIPAALAARSVPPDK